MISSDALIVITTLSTACGKPSTINAIRDLTRATYSANERPFLQTECIEVTKLVFELQRSFGTWRDKITYRESSLDCLQLKQGIRCVLQTW